MSTIEDFKNAPIGATTTRGDGGRAMKMDDSERGWIIRSGAYLNDEQMARFGYTLTPSAPTTAREALDLTWELAHPVKEGQVIPDGTRYLEFSNDVIREYIAYIDFTVRPGFEPIIRTFDPLPDPEPDWLDAPAVLATCYGCDEDGQAQSVHVPSFRWWRCTVCTSDVSWRILDDATPLYPKGQDA